MDNTTFKTSYDVIIIGSGAGGLTAGALLSKAGLSVCVLEKEPRPGGYLAGFSRKDFRFDTAIHWLNQYSKEGMVSKLFAALGSDFPKAITQQRIRLYKGDDHEYLLTNQPDELKEQWKKEFPEDRAGIEKFFRDAKNIGAAFKNFGHIFRAEETMSFTEKIFRKKNLIRFAWHFIPHLRFSGEAGMEKGLSKYFSNKKLKAVFSADTEILSCIVPIGWAYNNDFQSPPPGGGQVITEWLAHIIGYFNQEIHYRCEVKQITTENGLVTGASFVHAGKTSAIKCKYLIAASDLPSLYNSLLAKELVPARLKTNLAKAELYPSSFTVSIALDCPAELLGFNEEMIHLTSAAVPRGQHGDCNPSASEITILAPSFRDKSLAPDGQGTLVLFMPADLHFEHQWRTETEQAGKTSRGTAYKELKQTIALELIRRVEEKIAPGLSSHILFYEVATPVTHQRYTSNTGGSMMATKPNRMNMMKKVAAYHTPVKNLLVGGHWAELGGGIPIAVKAGANAAILVLKKQKPASYKALVSYIDGGTDLHSFERSNSFQTYPNNWVQKLTPSQRKKLMQSKTIAAATGTQESGEAVQT